MLEKRRFLKLFLIAGILIPVLTGFCGFSPAHAAKEIPKFESKNPGILPFSPFYFLKQWRRDIIRSFTKDPLSQAVFELETLDEKAAELKRVNSLRPDDADAIAQALKNYKNSQRTLRDILSGLDAERIKSEKKERLVEEIIKKVSAHEEYLSTLSNMYAKEKNVRPLAEGAQELAVEVVKASQAISRDAFKDVAKEYLRDDSVLRIVEETDASSSPVLAETINESVMMLSASTTEDIDPEIKESKKSSE